MFGLLLLMAIPVSCLVYLVWTSARSGSVDRVAPGYARRSVRFHGIWGMVLSLPLVVNSAFMTLGPDTDWSGRLLLAVPLSCWAIAIAAMLGRKVPAPLTWLPLLVTAVALAVLPAAGSDTWGGYVFYFAIFTMAGLGLAAWVLVSVNFALSVRRDQKFRSTPAPVAAAVSHFEPGFVWPS